ncbi:MAG: putative toxin-antitoxin system toxin component, PIN family [Pirellulaceae bacterium]
MRVVLDTNVLLAGVATHGLCEGIVAVSFRDHTVVLSEHILSEVAEHYVGKFKASARQAEAVVKMLRKNSNVVAPAHVPTGAFKDADDLPVLGTAVTGAVDCLVTGDKKLLRLRGYQGIPILSPRDFYDRIQAGS